MAKITIIEPVTIDIRIDGETIAQEFTPGDIDVPAEVAELLIAQGLATPKSGKTTKNTPAAPVEATPTAIETTEA